MSRFLFLLVAVVSWVAAGCWGSDRPRVVAVSGTVLLGGEPVEEAGVTFTPTGGRPATGRTDAQGRFSLTTFDPGDGAIVGQHVVTIVKAETVEVTFDSQAREPIETVKRPPGKLVPQRYGDPRQSRLSATVTADGNNDFRFELTE